MDNMLGSPSYRNFNNKEKQILDKMYDKIDECGQKNVEFVNKSSGKIIELPIYCDNRSCDNNDCKKHRLYKYLREHQGQIKALSYAIKNPLGWVFTGWKLRIDELDKDFCREKLRLLNELLKEYSRTPYSIHMEIKVYRKYDFKGNFNDDYGYCYLHFHVVCGGIKDLKTVRKIWGRQIRYEVAILPMNLGFYVAKYASKTPIFDDEYLRNYYHLLVYKTQMHRYSLKKHELEQYESNWIPMDVLRFEVQRCLRRFDVDNSFRRCWEDNKRLLNIRRKYGLESYGLDSG